MSMRINKFKMHKGICITVWLSFLNVLLIGQCIGPQNSGSALIFPNGMPSMYPIDINGLNIDFSSSADMVSISGPVGMTFHNDVTNAGFVANLPSATGLSGLSYVPGPLKLWDRNMALPNGFGTFAGGSNGFIAFSFGGQFGWIELSQCGYTSCSEYQFNIDDAVLLGSGVTTQSTGFCPAITANPIPTLSQWSLLILALNLLIIGLVKYKGEVKQTYVLSK